MYVYKPHLLNILNVMHAESTLITWRPSISVAQSRCKVLFADLALCYVYEKRGIQVSLYLWEVLDYLAGELVGG